MAGGGEVPVGGARCRGVVVVGVVGVGCQKAMPRMYLAVRRNASPFPAMNRV